MESTKSILPSSKKRRGKDGKDGKEGKEGKDNRANGNIEENGIDTRAPFLRLTVLTSHPTYGGGLRYFVKRFSTDNDYNFLMLLLSRTSSQMFEALQEFSTPQFHENLIEFSVDRDWGLDELRRRITDSGKGKKLKIVDTDLLIVPPAVRKLKGVVEINISSNNYLSDLGNLAGQTDLKSLKVKGCNVKDIKTALTLTNLVELDISENDVDEIPPGIVNLTQLVSLNVKKNPPLKRLPDEILSMEKLTMLEVEEEKFNAIEKGREVFTTETNANVFRRISSVRSTASASASKRNASKKSTTNSIITNGNLSSKKVPLARSLSLQV